MKRYDMTVVYNATACEDQVVPVESADGLWIRYEDAVEHFKAKIKEEAYEAYWEASDNNRADRWAEHFDESVRKEFEKYWKDSGTHGVVIPEESTDAGR